MTKNSLWQLTVAASSTEGSDISRTMGSESFSPNILAWSMKQHLENIRRIVCECSIPCNRVFCPGMEFGDIKTQYWTQWFYLVIKESKVGMDSFSEVVGPQHRSNMFRYTSQFFFTISKKMRRLLKTIQYHQKNAFIYIKYSCWILRSLLCVNQRKPCRNLHSRGLSATRTSRLGYKRWMFGVMKREDNFCRKPTPTARRMEKTILKRKSTLEDW